MSTTGITLDDYNDVLEFTHLSIEMTIVYGRC
jgi:hypothetical protein